MKERWEKGKSKRNRATISSRKARRKEKEGGKLWEERREEGGEEREGEDRNTFFRQCIRT